MHHRPAALAVAQFLSTGNGGKPLDNEAGKRLAKRVNLTLSTVNLDALAPNLPVDHVAVREWCRESFDPTLYVEELPEGPDEEQIPEESVEAVRSLLVAAAD